MEITTKKTYILGWNVHFFISFVRTMFCAISPILNVCVHLKKFHFPSKLNYKVKNFACIYLCPLCGFLNGNKIARITKKKTSNHQNQYGTQNAFSSLRVYCSWMHEHQMLFPFSPNTMCYLMYVTIFDAKKKEWKKM